MIGLIAGVLLLIPLAAPFGEATATAISADDGLRLEVSVEVAGTPVAVLVRGVGDGLAELPPVALADRGNGTWEGIVELPVVDNIRLGFESIPERGVATISELRTLTELGVDSAIFAVDRPIIIVAEEDDEPAPGRRWGWLGLAAGAAAMTLVAVWVIDSYRSDDDAGETGADGAGDDDPIVD